ncbi:MAG TPA: fumarate hydratase [Bacilli bacterium]|nr:MAG: L(+)-tartrate dehydratase subunit alpha [Tenericutes bacterium ADurb.BinA124]HNZ50209.1 fumarate hydratase [Bacilli bacterium]HPN61262.1 fumarate hydratase [Bacilli bacterium]HPX83914.1 fumarate hydratase [Bacilli bacterium]
MRKILLSEITKTVMELLLEANTHLGEDVFSRLKQAITQEESKLGKSIIEQIVKNDEIAKDELVPMCQDTGMVVIFLEIGSQVVWEGDLDQAINEGVRLAYQKGYFRKSVVDHPLLRLNTQDNTPAIIHTKIVPGENIKITAAPKGGGAENVSLVKMLIPADGKEGIKKLVLQTIKEAGGKPCPPIIVGLGIGGNLEKAALMAKEALMRDLNDETSDPTMRALEQELLQEINNLGIGPMGLGGRITALAVKINYYPTHIASLPVAINLQCHAARHQSRVI